MIKNIIFDFGNIIGKFDYSLSNYMGKYSEDVRNFLIKNVIYSDFILMKIKNQFPRKK